MTKFMIGFIVGVFVMLIALAPRVISSIVPGSDKTVCITHGARSHCWQASE